ncbi:hypothetical protein KUTeg_004202 [Tegillarca granosa]|uniref:Uncharacterized protein n=1 Tax=Tegillarca granosa TaxID=220873 RepID=A0ABQ9FQW3_TEGGR|nr:hypothetical protein KUTeg_004202 [Tegillarca granosa]
MDKEDSAPWSLTSLLFVVFCLVYAVYQVVILIRAISGKLENPLQHEEGREMGGLIIIITWTGISRFTNLGRYITV